MSVARSLLSFLSYLAVAVCLALFAWSQANAVEKLEEVSEPIPLPNFELENTEGALFDLSDMKGQWNLVTLGFTSCPDICPFVLTNLSAVSKKLASLGIAELPRVVFVGVDPYRDRPILKEYVSHFGDNVIGVTGSHGELEKFAKGINASYVIRPKKGGSSSDKNYDVLHSAFVVLVSPEGKIVARMNPPLPSEDTAKFLLEMINANVAYRY